MLLIAYFLPSVPPGVGGQHRDWGVREGHVRHHEGHTCAYSWERAQHQAHAQYSISPSAPARYQKLY